MKKKILLIALGILLLLSVINFYSGTTIIINGKQVTSPFGYIGAYIGLIALAVALVILIPSIFILAVLLSLIFIVAIMLFFPLMPLSSSILPAVVLVLIVCVVYRLVRKKKE